jgi:hypothetical protein
LGLPLTSMRTLGAACCVACGVASASGPSVATPEASHVPTGEEAPHAGAIAQRSGAEWPQRSELFLVRTGEAELALRAPRADSVPPFEHVLARGVGNVLYNPELDLVWYNVEGRLFVIDTRHLGPSTPEPVLIARDLPIVGGLRLERAGVHFTAPGAGQDEDDLVLHWDEAPWIEAGEEEPRIENLDGQPWLAREQHRPVRRVSSLQGFDASGPHVALPAGRGQCDDRKICGAALPFGSRGWQLLVANEDEDGDFREFRCLFHDPATQGFSTPPEAREWASAQHLESGTCGPFAFNAEGDTYLAASVVCHVGDACESLGEGNGIGWLEPGPMLGSY